MSAIDLPLSDLFLLTAQKRPQSTILATTIDHAETSADRIAALPLNRLLYLALVEKCVCAE